MSLKTWIASRYSAAKLRPAVERFLGRELTRKEYRNMTAFIASIFGNWKTTLAGFAASIIQMYVGGMSWRAILMALPTLILGIAAKDSTTGSQPQ